MTAAEKHIRHFNLLNGNLIGKKKLKKFYDSVEKLVKSGDKTPALKVVCEKLDKALKMINGKAVRLRFKPVVNNYTVTESKHSKDFSLSDAYGLELSNPEGEESKLGFTQEGQQKIYDMITNMVLDTMKKDGLFWRSKWDAGGAYNARSFPALRPYNGANWFLLTMMANLNFGYASPYFLTFKAIKQAGGSVRRKAERWPVVYYSRVYKLDGKTISEEQFNKLPKDVQDDDVDILPFIQYYSVFNGDDVEGVALPKTKHQEAILAKSEPAAIESCEKIVAAMKNRPDIDHGHRSAHYLPSSDKIDMPDKRAFADMQAYYSVLFHEMVHSTGHKTRVKRNMSGDHESKEYFFEELIAELGASYLCAHAGILYHTLDDSAAYVKHYGDQLKEIMKDDKKFFLRAAAAAQRAVDYILGHDTKARKKEKRKGSFTPKSRGKKNRSKKSLDSVIIELWLISRTALAKMGIPSRWDRMQYVKKELHRSYSDLIKDLSPKKLWFKIEDVTSPTRPLNGIKKTKVVKAPKSKHESKRPLPPVERKESSKAAAGHSKKSALSGLQYASVPLNEEFKKDFHRVNSDNIIMVWGLPGSGKTYKLLKFAKYLNENYSRPLYFAEEEYGRSTLTEKLAELDIQDGKHIDFEPELDENKIKKYKVIFFDSVNSMGLGVKEMKRIIRNNPGKLWILIVQTTKDGDFRGGQDWEHLVDIAGEVVNRKLILRKNRLDKNNGEKAQALRVEEEVNKKLQRKKINDLVQEKIKPAPAAPATV